MGPPSLTVLFASTLNLLTRLWPTCAVCQRTNFFTRAYVEAIFAYIGALEKTIEISFLVD